MFHKRFKFISLEHSYLDHMNQDDIPKNYLVNLVTHDVGTRHTNLVMKLFFFFKLIMYKLIIINFIFSKGN